MVGRRPVSRPIIIVSLQKEGMLAVEQRINAADERKSKLEMDAM